MKKITLLLLLFVATLSAQPGLIDATFSTGLGPNSAVVTSVTQPDGKIVIGGAFSTYNGVACSRIARLNPDGSLDYGFNPVSGLPSGEEIYTMALQPDGKIIIGGFFSAYDGVSRNHIARINPDGTLDTSFSPGTGANNYIASVALQSDGKIIAGGFFTSFDGSSRNRIVRLNPDGSIDNTFAMGSGTNEYVYTISVLQDDKIYVGGGFTTYNGVNVGHFTRLNPDGTRDTSFAAGTPGNNSVLTHAVQPDGKIVIGGYFTTYVGNSRPRIARLNVNGSLDLTFSVGTGLNNYPLTMVAQPNGKILVGGAFTTYNGATVNRLVRLNADGSRDTGFVTGTSLSDIAYWSAFQPDGKLLIGSAATTYNGNSSYPYLVRLNGYDPNSLDAPMLSGDIFCQGESISIDYTADGYYAVGNQFTAQLSDASGSFASPTNIGTVTATDSGSIQAVIPALTTPGSGYRIRVISSNLATTGADNGQDLTINQAQTFYADADDDGFGDASVTALGCQAPDGYVDNSDDCNDQDPDINPNAAEIPGNGIDENCNDQIDEGFFSQLLPLQCGATLTTIGTTLGAVSVAGATGYRFEVTNLTNNATQTLDRVGPNFVITQLPVYDYGTTYSVRVQVQMNNVWTGYYGVACLISTPDVAGSGGAAQVTASQCGTTLNSVSTLIATTSLPGISVYRFRVTDLTDLDGPNQVQVIDRGLHWFSLPMLARYNYSTDYQIEVAVKTANGTFTDFGQPCVVSTPDVADIALCGAQIPSLSTIVSTASLLGVTAYRFEVTNVQTMQSEVINRPVNWFRLNMLSSVDPSTSYNVRVAVETKGQFSPYSQGCLITSPAAARGESRDVVDQFQAVAFPNPFSQSVSISLSDVSQVDLLAYDMTGRLIENKTIDVVDGNVSWGDEVPSGVYQIILRSGSETKVLRVIKR